MAFRITSYWILLVHLKNVLIERGITMSYYAGKAQKGIPPQLLDAAV